MPTRSVVTFLLTLILGITASVSPVRPQQAPSLDQRIDGLFEDWNRRDTPGAAVAVIRDGQIVYRKAFGMADLERSVPLTPESAFEIGSIAKQFTAMCVLLLAHDGALALDDDVRTWVPELPDYGEPITLRHLLHHTSGIRDIETLIPLAGLSWVNYMPPAAELEIVTRQEGLNFAPNSRHLYSNSGYLLLGLVVERVSDRSLAQFAAERIFEPLEMSHTVFWERPGQLIGNRALAYAPDGQPDPQGREGFRLEMWNLPFVGPAGLYTTVDDLARWDANFYDNRLGGGAELIELMETPGVLDDGEAIDYAAGLVVSDLWGLRTVRHGGAWMGYRAGMMRFPDQRLTVILLSNAATIDVGTGSIARLCLEGVIDDPQPAADAFEPPPPVELDPATLARHAGRYWSATAALLRTIELRDGSLFYSRGAGNDTELAPLGPGWFLMAGLPFRVDVVFGGHDPRTMTVIDGEEELVFEEVVATPETALSGLGGRYWSEELQRELHLEVDSGRLQAAWAGEAGRTAEPIGPDEYLLPAFIPVPWSTQDVRLRVVRDERRAVDGLILGSEMVEGVRLTRLD